jgi:hypothetical protein
LAAGGGEIGFDWLCFGLKLGLFSKITQFDIFSYSFVWKAVTNIFAFWKLALIGFELGLFSPSVQLDLFS